jgi:hypothetical protein
VVHVEAVTKTKNSPSGVQLHPCARAVVSRARAGWVCGIHVGWRTDGEVSQGGGDWIPCGRAENGKKPSDKKNVLFSFFTFFYRIEMKVGTSKTV